MMSVVSIVIVTLVCSRSILPVKSERILAIETIAAKSHWNFMSSVLRALTDNGHEVTVFTPYLDGNRENYTEIDTSSIFPSKINMNFMDIRKSMKNSFVTISFLVELGRHSCDILYNNDQLNDILTKDISLNFDAIFIEPKISNCFKYIVGKSDLPLVFVVPLPNTFLVERFTFGDISNPATVSSLLANYAVPETFNHRFVNTVLYIYKIIIVAFQESSMKLLDPKPYDLNTPVSPSLVFVNGHFISDAPRPIPSNAIYVGGIHLRPSNGIPKDILEFIENSPHGVILFTFGSTIEFSLLPENIQRVFIEVLALLPQRVLMKYDSEMKDRPNNIMTQKWLPQRDILVHPKVKLFISHGGISGLYEAVDAGVPVLGIPLFADQPRNIDNLVNAGMAISMDIFSVSKVEFLKNVEELVNNEKYTENAKIASDIFHDRPMSPEKSVVYWTEYVIRHKGAPHLKSQAMNLSLYQYFLLDVIALVLIIVFLVVFIIFKLYKCVDKYFMQFPDYFKTKTY